MTTRESSPGLLPDEANVLKSLSPLSSVSISAIGVQPMDKEHIKGAADQIKGKAKEVTGLVSGDRKLEHEGTADQVKGSLHHAAGEAKDAGKEAIDSVKNAPSRH